MRRLRVTRLEQKKLWPGVALILLGVLAPLIFNIETFGVTDSLIVGLRTKEKVEILMAAFRLALLNAMRCFPHYLGAFFIADSFEVEYDGKKQGWLNVVVVVGLILAVYQTVDAVHHIHYDFGGPALMLVTLQVLMWMVNYSYIHPLKKVPMMMVFIMAFQFLDVMPMLSGLPFGRGETSHDIKLAASVLDCGALLDNIMLVFFLTLLVMGALLFIVLRDENHVWQISELKEQNERIRMEAWMRERENRSTRELQHLVHDLKSPLTVIQTLAGALQYKCSAPEQQQEREYLSRIEASVDHMSNMISEILYEDRKVSLTTRAVIDIVLAQISPADYCNAVFVRNDCPDAIIRVNSLRFARAIINLVENAYHARQNGDIRIHIQVDLVQRDRDELVRFVVADNGKGIPKEELDKVWERGYSKRGSSGLGMSFIRDVVEQSDGEIHMDSTCNLGTKVTILLPKGEAET